MGKLNKAEVKKILVGLQTINPDEISIDNKIDFSKFDSHPQIQKAVRKLKGLGVTKDYLMKEFTIAGILMAHLF